MRVLLNGRDIGGLEPHLERRLWGRRSDQVVEGVAISPEQSIAARSRQLRLMLGGAAALVAVILALNLFIVAARAPQAMGYVAVAAAMAVAVTSALMFGLYALMLGDHRHRVEARATNQLAPGTPVRLDPAGLSVGGHASAWSALSVEQLAIRQRLANKQRITYVEQLTLVDAQRRVNLDALFLGNGRAVLEQAWFRARAAEPRP
jgi:hypothetical protein